MLSTPRYLNPAEIERLITLIRDGSSVALVCHRAYEDFSPATIYEVQKVVRGEGLEVIDDQFSAVVLDESFPALGCFVVADSAEQAQELSSEMKRQNLAGLVGRVSHLMTKNEFAPGQVVKWKDGMAMSTMPMKNQPAIVTRVLRKPVVTEDAHLLDPVRTLRCDMEIAFEHEGGVIVTTLADSRRFEHYDMQVKGLEFENEA